MSEWQTIESAPKDGTAILGWDGGTALVILWHRGGGYWIVEWDGHRIDDWCTHWQPLPAPPLSKFPGKE